MSPFHFHSNGCSVYNLAAFVNVLGEHPSRDLPVEWSVKSYHFFVGCLQTLRVSQYSRHPFCSCELLLFLQNLTIYTATCLASLLSTSPQMSSWRLTYFSIFNLYVWKLYFRVVEEIFQLWLFAGAAFVFILLVPD